MVDFVRNNPALFYSFAIGLAASVIAVIAAFGVPITAELHGAISGLITLIASIIIGFVTRGKVVPFKNVLEYRRIEQDGSLSVDVVAGPANDMEPEGHVVRGIQPNNESEPIYDRH